LLTDRAAEKMLHLDLAAVVGLLIDAQTGRPDTIRRCGITLVLGATYTRRSSVSAQGKLPAGTDKALAYMDKWLLGYKPTTVLYFPAPRTRLPGQMWLETMAELDGRPLVILPRALHPAAAQRTPLCRCCACPRHPP